MKLAQKNSCAMKHLLVTRKKDFESATIRLRQFLFAPVCNFAHFPRFFAVIEL
jgi:hypothetical protein